MNLIIGLGNPGPQYQNTRHNFGFMAVDAIAGTFQIPVKNIGCKAVWGRGRIGGTDVVLAKPQTYMNLSGMSALDLTTHFGIPQKDVIVIYDDMDLPLGKLRIRPRGGAGTHNGMKSVIYQLGSEEFPRIRLGIGTPPEGMDAAGFVLSHFAPEEAKLASEVLKRVCEAVEVMLTAGIDEAMNRFN